MKFIIVFLLGVYVEKGCRDNFDKGFVETVMELSELGKSAVQMHRESPVSRIKFQ